MYAPDTYGNWFKIEQELLDTGRQEGRQEMAEQVVGSLTRSGMPEAEIQSHLGLTADELESVRQRINGEN